MSGTRHLGGSGYATSPARFAQRRPTLVYSNSLFSRINLRFLVGRLAGVLPRAPFLLAPRGELSPGALRLKAFKKSTFLHAAARAGVFRRVAWHASTELERTEIVQALTRHGAAPPDVHVAKDLFRITGSTARAGKDPRRVRFVFLSRISRKKNLAFAIERVATLAEPATLSVFGPVEDASYWEECRRLALRRHVSLTHGGEIVPDQVHAVFSQHDFFLFPTFGENFGHVIVESLAAGCPVILSDQTPWRDLQSFPAGWVLPLAAVDEWDDVLRTCAAMSAEEHERYSAGARRAARELGRLEEAKQATRELLHGIARGRVASDG